MDLYGKLLQERVKLLVSIASPMIEKFWSVLPMNGSFFKMYLQSMDDDLTHLEQK